MPLTALNKIEVSQTTNNKSDEGYLDIPIDISDIINICKEYNKLGWQIQKQVESITEMGIDEAISSGSVKVISLPHIKDFLCSVSDNMYFGDAADQAKEAIALIEVFEMKNPGLFELTSN